MLSRTLLVCCLWGATLATTKMPLGLKSALAIKEMALNFDDIEADDRVESMNDMADVWIGEVRLLMGENGYEPLELPDIHKNFSYKPVIIKYHGELDLLRGWAQEISEVYRNGDVFLDYTDRNLTVHVPIIFPQLLINYDYRAKLMGLGPQGSVDGTVKNLQIVFTLSLDFKELHVELISFEIEKIGKINAKFRGNALFDWFVNLLTKITLTLFNGVVTWIAEGTLRDILLNLVDVINELFQQMAPNPFSNVIATPLQQIL